MGKRKDGDDVSTSLRPLSIALRAVVILVVAGALLILAASTALADNGPHVQGATGGTGASAIATADGCAGCHRAHTASASSLLVSGGDAELCLTCHGSPTQGATTNVVDGTLAASNPVAGIMGGGFTNARMDTAWTATPTSPTPSRAVTSAHVYGGGLGTLWGSGAINSGPGETGFALSCVSCHNPHGNGQYRILRPIPMNAPSTTPVTVPDPATKVYTVTSSLNRYFGQIYMNGVYNDQLALTQWCASCHSRYDAAGPNSANTSSGDAIYTYRHGTRKVPANAASCDSCHDQVTGEAADPLGVGSAIAHVPVCQNCHVAHGAPATMGTESGAVPWPDGATSPNGNARSSMLRVDNRGVCRACHGR
jgi:predicted CXXCH cytochrome family protein